MPDIDVTFDSDEQVTTISNPFLGPETPTLDETDFSETDNGDGTYSYSGTATVNTNGEYLSQLSTASDSSGNNGGGGDADFAFVNQTVVADHESGDLSEWTDTRSTDSASTTQPYQGSYEFYCDGTGSTTASSPNANLSISDAAYDSVVWHLYLVSQGSSNRPQLRTRNSSVGNLGALVTFSDSLEVQYYDGSGYVNLGYSITTGQYYKFALENIDYTNDQFDLRVYENPRSANPTQVGSSTGLSFGESMSSIDTLSPYSNGSEYYIDELRTY